MKSIAISRKKLETSIVLKSKMNLCDKILKMIMVTIYTQVHIGFIIMIASSVNVDMTDTEFVNYSSNLFD